VRNSPETDDVVAKAEYNHQSSGFPGGCHEADVAAAAWCDRFGIGCAALSGRARSEKTTPQELFIKGFIDWSGESGWVNGDSPGNSLYFLKETEFLSQQHNCELSLL
jgi:hypothetical protein